MKAILVSFVAHAIVLGGLLVGAIMAPERMPRLITHLVNPLFAEPMAPRDIALPPSPPKSPAASARMQETPIAAPAKAAPVVAPDGIAPERVVDVITPAIAGLVTFDGNALAIPGTGIAPPPPPPVPAPKPPVRLHSGITSPRKVVDVPPSYPELARIARAQGIVIVEATIDERGTVVAARILRSVPLLDEAALTAVRQWKFTPAQLNGEAIPVVMTVTVNFELR